MQACSHAEPAVEAFTQVRSQVEPATFGEEAQWGAMPPRPNMPKAPCTTEWWEGKILASKSKDGWMCFWDATSVKEKIFKYGDNKSAAFTKAMDCIEAYQRGFGG